MAGAAGLLTAAAHATERFPRPEFRTEHPLPTLTEPVPRILLFDKLDVAVLAVALGLAAYLVLRRRSRRSLVLLMLFSLLYFGFWRGGCVCPVGSVQNVALALFGDGYAIPLSAIAFFALPLVAALAFGRVFCAAVCPLGIVQDLVAVRPLQQPGWLDGALRVVPYAVLGVSVLLAALGAGFMVCRYDPFVGLFRLSASTAMLAGAAVLLAVGVVVARPYCRYLCPYGVLLGWFSRLSLVHATVTPGECLNCPLCERACPVNAIRRPTPERLPEPRGTAIRRLARLLVLLPVLGLAGAWAGARLHGWAAGAHPTVRLIRQMGIEHLDTTAPPTMESETFRGTGVSNRQLYDEAVRTQARFATGCTALGAFLGLALGAKLVSLSVFRSRTGHEPDRAWCLSCGRCFASCPVERKRREGGAVVRPGADRGSAG